MLFRSNDYWAYSEELRANKMSVSLREWARNTLLARDGRAAAHPRYIYFICNTVLRSKALTGRNFFAQRVKGTQVEVEYSPDDLMKMSKADMSRSLCAYETKMPGSAAEKLQQRNDLESMLNQLEEESWTRVSKEMPLRHHRLSGSMAALT